MQDNDLNQGESMSSNDGDALYSGFEFADDGTICVAEERDGNTSFWVCKKPASGESRRMRVPDDLILKDQIRYRIVYFSNNYSRKYVDPMGASLNWQDAFQRLNHILDTGHPGSVPLNGISFINGEHIVPVMRQWHPDKALPWVFVSDDLVSLCIERTASYRASLDDDLYDTEDYELYVLHPVIFNVYTGKIHYDKSICFQEIQDHFQIQSSVNDHLEATTSLSGETPTYEQLLAEVDRLREGFRFLSVSHEEWVKTSYEAESLLREMGWVPAFENQKALTSALRESEERFFYKLSDLERDYRQKVREVEIAAESTIADLQSRLANTQREVYQLKLKIDQMQSED